MEKDTPGKGYCVYKFSVVKEQSIHTANNSKWSHKGHILGNIREEGERWLRGLMFHKEAFLIYFSLEQYALKDSSCMH